MMRKHAHWLYPRNVHGVEVVNANRTERENKMADIYMPKIMACLNLQVLIIIVPQNRKNWQVFVVKSRYAMLKTL